MNKGLIIALVVVAIVVVGGAALFGGNLTSTETATPTPQQTTQQVPADIGSDVEEKVVEENGDAMEEDGDAMVEAREIIVDGEEFSFSPARISVKEGEKVKLTFNNVGSFPHNLKVEGLNIGTSTIGGGESETIEFTVEEGGTYSTFCSVANHRAQGMEGVLTAE